MGKINMGNLAESFLNEHSYNMQYVLYIYIYIIYSSEMHLRRKNTPNLREVMVMRMKIIRVVRKKKRDEEIDVLYMQIFKDRNISITK